MIENYQLPFTAQEIEARLLWLDKLYREDTNHSEYFEINEDGIISLKPEYRGYGRKSFEYSISDNGEGFRGSLNHTLPEHIYIPEKIGTKTVLGLQEGTFAKNTTIKEVTLNRSITILPQRLFSNAFYFRALYGSENIIEVQTGCFSHTSIKELSLPKLQSLQLGAFGAACYLQKIDIGNYIQELPQETFSTCLSLSTINGGASVKTVGKRCFYLTRCLKTLPFLNNAGLILGEQAFTSSRIQFDWTSRDASNDGAYATPVVDNTIDYWSNASYIPCQANLPTKLSQLQKDWAEEELGKTGTIYSGGCAYFSAMHIHSALSGKYYSDPRQFIEELAQNEAMKPYVNQKWDDPTSKWLGRFENNLEFFQKLGYEAKEFKDNLTKESYQEMCDALAQGAVVYTTCTHAGRQIDNNYSDGGHAVVIYGINNNGEVCVLDSAVYAEGYREVGLMSDDFYIYATPHQNIVGPNSDFIIVYPLKQEGNE